MRKKNACILGEIINCLSKKNKKNFEKKGKKWLTISERSGIIFNVAANNGNTTMTTQKQFEKFYEQRNNFLKRNKKVEKSA